MTFEYLCETCNAVIERNFPLGGASDVVTCEDCGTECKRHYGGMNFVLKGPAGQWPSKKGRFNQEMTDRNEAARRRMVKERTGTAPQLIDQR